METAPRFAVDVMLGKLAKWLRLMGVDTFYSNAAEDGFLKMLTVREKRILLTRDRPLSEQLGNSAYFVQNIFLPKQLEEITTVFRLYRFHLPSRCSLCNSILAPIPRDLVQYKVPVYVFQTQKEFFQCKKCDKIYWKGTHIQRIRERITQILGKVATIPQETADE